MMPLKAAAKLASHILLHSLLLTTVLTDRNFPVQHETMTNEMKTTVM